MITTLDRIIEINISKPLLLFLEHVCEEQLFYIVSPKDIIIAKVKLLRKKANRVYFSFSLSPVYSAEKLLFLPNLTQMLTIKI